MRVIRVYPHFGFYPLKNILDLRENIWTRKFL